MKFFFLGIILCSFLQGSAHDIHVSVTEIYEDDKGKIEVSIRIFFDDLLTAVGLEPGQELPEDYSSSDELIESYINQHFVLKINGEIQNLQYVESIATMPAVWVSFQNDDFNTKITSIEIENRILTDLFDDQTNMVNIEIAGKRKSFALNGKKKTALMDL